jgi:hypothetical protein
MEKKKVKKKEALKVFSFGGWPKLSPIILAILNCGINLLLLVCYWLITL